MPTPTSSDFPLLYTLTSPEELRKLPAETLPEVASELRRYLIQTLNHCGGHFAAGLGTVELTIALHYLFNTPLDQILWDVGHQAYPHKVLTGRRESLASIRQYHGLAPFPSREESPYDCFGVGHSSTSISAALGMALAAKAQGQDHKTVAVIGDGGLTGGMAFEALNHAGSTDADLLVILNDNEMSISRNVGALTNYLARILSGKIYSHLREGSKKVFSHLPALRALAKRTETHVKGMVTPGTLFEELGIHYYGPIDGHDLPMLLSMLGNLRELKGSRLLHVITKKGKGYLPAEAEPIEYHAVKSGFLTPQEKTTGSASAVVAPTFSSVFGQWLCEMAEQDSRLVAITPAMCEGSGMTEFATRFADRYFDVGIAEQHSLTLAAGMACGGLKPVVAIYSTFLQRAYDQLIHDIALQNLPVVLAIDRGGLVGGDGATHHGYFDLTYLRCIPNLTVMAPCDANECRDMLYTAFRQNTPTAVRYPRGHSPGELSPSWTEIPLGRAKLCRQGKRIALLAFGSMVLPALTVGEKLGATVVNMRFIKPLDTEMIQNLAKTHDYLVTLEENVISGGAGSAVLECLAQNQITIPTLTLGLPDRFVTHGDPAQLLDECGLCVASIESAVLDFTQPFTTFQGI